jgi:predicted nucleic acid-binding protein
MIHLDTSLLVDALAGAKRSAGALRARFAEREFVRLSAPVVYEWLRGPRRPEEIAAQEELFPAETTAVFGPREAVIAAELYKRVSRARTREFDLAVAACAISHGAALWTLNRKDFEDIPGLALI